VSKQTTEEEGQHILLRFCTSPRAFNLARHTCTRSVGAWLIRHGITFALGEGYYAKTEPLGCGVYRVHFVSSTGSARKGAGDGEARTP
jgi:hypothetical protein